MRARTLVVAANLAVTAATDIAAQDRWQFGVAGGVVSSFATGALPATYFGGANANLLATFGDSGSRWVGRAELGLMRMQRHTLGALLPPRWQDFTYGAATERVFVEARLLYLWDGSGTALAPMTFGWRF